MELELELGGELVLAGDSWEVNKLSASLHRW
jgi:hypothetical protein